MKRNRPPSKSTLCVLEALVSAPDADRYGYELMKTTGIKSGTLYPILMRLKDRGLLEATWRQPTLSGKPARQAYRLTQAGLRYAQGALQGKVSATALPLHKGQPDT